MKKNSSSQGILKFLDDSIRKEFASNLRILGFDEYLNLIAENPEQQLRNSSQYTLGMLDHFGIEESPRPDKKTNPFRPDGNFPRFKLFDLPLNAVTSKVVGHERVQNQLYRGIKTFARIGANNKLLLLHGPNGSAKSCLIHSIMGGLEKYSQTPEGAAYTFNWIFPLERYTKGKIGLHSGSASEGETSSFARIPEEEIAARIPCDLKDHPFLLIPKEQRLQFLQELLGNERANTIWSHLSSYLKSGELCHRCREIYDALLTTHNGDYLRVLMNIQVERMFFSRRYRRGLVTIEPQLHVDAQYLQLSLSRSLSSLPASLQSLNLFALTGDLVQGNRGIVEYSDLLKRPIDTFKYLLGVCENGSINIQNSIAHLDTVMLGSTNEVQLDAFKEFPDFTSFKARIELIRVPYLISVSQEKQIYEDQLPQIAGEKHVAPHVAWAIALWSVLTRLKKPNTINYPPNIASIISNLTPLQKSKLYDTAEMPETLSLDERKLLRSSLERIFTEYTNIPYYEGRMGASAREMKSILSGASQSTDHKCLSPLSVLRELEDFVKKVSEYDFLKQDVKDGYHDCVDFIQKVRAAYLDIIDHEVRDCMGLYDSDQWEDFMKKYVLHVSLVLKKEKVKNSITGRMEDPDHSLISEFEKIVKAPSDAKEKEKFRQSIISQVGVWSLDHPDQPMQYSQVFPQHWQSLEKHYYESQKALLTRMSEALMEVNQQTQSQNLDTESRELARLTVENMTTRLGYCKNCAAEVITFLMKQRY